MNNRLAPALFVKASEAGTKTSRTNHPHDSEIVKAGWAWIGRGSSMGVCHFVARLSV